MKVRETVAVTNFIHLKPVNFPGNSNQRNVRPIMIISHVSPSTREVGSMHFGHLNCSFSWRKIIKWIENRRKIEFNFIIRHIMSYIVNYGISRRFIPRIRFYYDPDTGTIDFALNESQYMSSAKLTPFWRFYLVNKCMVLICWQDHDGRAFIII